MRNPFQMIAVAAVLFTAVHGSVSRLHAGGGPMNALVVVNETSIESLQLGYAYAERHGIPERQVCHVHLPPASLTAANQNVTNSVFQTGLVDRVFAHIAQQGLSNQIDFAVLCKDIPSRVNDNEGATAVLFYGCTFAPAIVSVCSMPTNTRQHYYMAERAFSRADTYGGTNYLPSFLLVSSNLATCISNATRGAQADGNAPAGCFYLLNPPSDPNRNVRYRLADNFDFVSRFTLPPPTRSILNADVIENKTNVMGYMTGTPNVADISYSKTNRYLVGALADHLTSFGGRLPGPTLGQRPAWDWLQLGAVATYGTVNEPCAYTQKFPDPMALYWYARGFNAAESYWMSVANPYQGLFMGDPLAQPYAKPPGLTVSGLSSNQTISGTITALVTATSNARGEPADRADVYVDGLWSHTLTQAVPRAGNVMFLSINNVTCSYTVAGGDDLYRAVTALTARVNASNLTVRAEAFGDRIQLVYTNYGYSGTAVSYRAWTEQGAAPECTIWGRGVTTQLLESAYRAREGLLLQGTAKTGDTVTCSITLTNGVVRTNRVVAAQGEYAWQVLPRLKQAINADPVLQASDGVSANPHTYQTTYQQMDLEARTPGPQGSLLYVDYEVKRATPPTSGLIESDSFSDFFNDNRGDMTARGQCFFGVGLDPLTNRWIWDTTGQPNGPCTLTFTARDGTAVRAPSRYALPLTISNSALQCVITSPAPNSVIAVTSAFQVCVAALEPAGSVTQAVLRVGGKEDGTDTTEPFTFDISAFDWGPGTRTLQARVWDSSGAGALSRPVDVTLALDDKTDTDGDTVGDAWEQHYFGGLYVYGATNDLDKDRLDNHREYVADTNPNSATSYFRMVNADWTNNGMAIGFLSSTARVYRFEYTDGFATNQTDWTVTTGSVLSGESGRTDWADDGTMTGTHPSNASMRAYRLRVLVP